MKKIVFIFLLFFILTISVNASPKCSKPTDEWIYQKTLTKTASDPGKSMVTDNENVICCEVGGGQTKQYYCDIYQKNSENENDNEEFNENNLSSNVCNPSKQDGLDENWSFIGCKTFYKGVDYTINSPEKEIPGVEKVICGVEGGSEAGVGQKWYKCDIYEWIGEAQEAPDNYYKNGPFVNKCDVDDTFVYSYSQVNIDNNLSGSYQNTKICCQEGSGATSGKYTCDIYVKKDFADNIIFPEKDQQGFNPGELCNGDNCNISLENFCIQPTVARTMKFIGLAVYILKILVPAIIIIIGITNLFKIMTSGKLEDAKKYSKTIIRNVIIGIIIFLAPGIINFVFDSADDIVNPNKESNFSNCRECLLNPNDGDKCVITED